MNIAWSNHMRITLNRSGIELEWIPFIRYWRRVSSGVHTCSPAMFSGARQATALTGFGHWNGHGSPVVALLSMNRAMLRSLILTLPCSSNSNCCGFRSKWTIGPPGASCRACKPRAVSRAIGMTLESGSRPLRRKMASSKVVEKYSVAIVVRQTPKRPTMLGCPLTCNTRRTRKQIRQRHHRGVARG